MKVRVTYKTGDIDLDDVFAGENAKEIVSSIQKTTASRSSNMGYMIQGLTPEEFAWEAIKYVNNERGWDLPIPYNCDQFVDVGMKGGFIKPVPNE